MSARQASSGKFDHVTDVNKLIAISILKRIADDQSYVNTDEDHYDSLARNPAEAGRLRRTIRDIDNESSHSGSLDVSSIINARPGIPWRNLVDAGLRAGVALDRERLKTLIRYYYTRRDEPERRIARKMIEADSSNEGLREALIFIERQRNNDTDFARRLTEFNELFDDRSTTVRRAAPEDEYI